MKIQGRFQDLSRSNKVQGLFKDAEGGSNLANPVDRNMQNAISEWFKKILTPLALAVGNNFNPQLW